MAISTILGGENLLRTATLTASADSANVDNVHDAFLTDFWQPGAGAQTIVIDHGSAVAIDYWGFSANLGSDGASIAIAWSDDDISYTTIETLNPTTNDVVMSEVTSVSHRYTKVTVTGTAPKIARLNVGTTVELIGTLTTPFTSPKNATEYVYTTNVTEVGLPGGRNVKRTKTPVKMKFKNVPVTWIDNDWPAIDELVRGDLVFLLWDALNRPTEAALCWITNDVKPSWSDVIYNTYELRFNCKT